MDRPHLILDCYLDELGAASSITPFLGARAHEIVRPPHGKCPANARDFASLWVTGSAASVLDPDPWIAALIALLRDALQHDVPIFGICFGHQALAVAHAGAAAVGRSPTSELGWSAIELIAPDPVLEGLPPRFDCFVSHFDEVAPGLAGIDVFARNTRCAVHGYRVRSKRAVAVQFHPEMPPAECERLVRANLLTHGYLGLDPEPLIARAVDARPLGAQLATNFLRSVDRRARDDAGRGAARSA